VRSHSFQWETSPALTGEHVLAPILRPGHIVIIDNLSAHHSKRVEQPITGLRLHAPFSARLFAGLPAD
jgi:hypothetical protein